MSGGWERISRSYRFRSVKPRRGSGHLPAAGNRKEIVP